MSTKIDVHAAQSEIRAENEKLLEAGLVLPVLEDGKVRFVSKQKLRSKAQSGKAA
jgi:hypothetical protein